MKKPADDWLERLSREKRAAFRPRETTPSRPVLSWLLLGLGAVALSLMSTKSQMDYVIETDGDRQLLVGVLGYWIFRLPFLILVFVRLCVTPHPLAGQQLPGSGLGCRGVFVQGFLMLGIFWHVAWAGAFLVSGILLGVLTSALWLLWLYGMAAREQAHGIRLRERKIG